MTRPHLRATHYCVLVADSLNSLFSNVALPDHVTSAWFDPSSTSSECLWVPERIPHLATELLVGSNHWRPKCQLLACCIGWFGPAIAVQLRLNEAVQTFNKIRAQRTIHWYVVEKLLQLSDPLPNLLICSRSFFGKVVQQGCSEFDINAPVALFGQALKVWENPQGNVDVFSLQELADENPRTALTFKIKASPALAHNGHCHHEDLLCMLRQMKLRESCKLFHVHCQGLLAKITRDEAFEQLGWPSRAAEVG